MDAVWLSPLVLEGHGAAASAWLKSSHRVHRKTQRVFVGVSLPMVKNLSRQVPGLKIPEFFRICPFIPFFCPWFSCLTFLSPDDGALRIWKNFADQKNPEMVTAWQGLSDMLPTTRGQPSASAHSKDQHYFLTSSIHPPIHLITNYPYSLSFFEYHICSPHLGHISHFITCSFHCSVSDDLSLLTKQKRN